MGFAEHAKAYHALGFCVMPLKKGDKKPMLNWEVFQSRRPTEEELDNWIRLYPDANIAIITGKVSGLVVLDIDGPEGVEALKGKHLPPTRIAKTGKGLHYYFKMPPDRSVGNSVGVFPKVDIRGEGGYVVAPGSVHPSGARYEWTMEEDTADCPIWLYEAQRIEKEKTGASKTDMPGWLEDMKKGVKEGGRNDACARLAGHYVRKGYEASDILDILLRWNQKNVPPLSDKEIETTLKSILEKDPNTPDILDAKPTALAEAKAVIQKWLYFKDETIVDVALAVMMSNYHKADPLWVVIVGPPSSGKTEILRAFDRHEDTYFIDNITPATFVTGFTKAKGILERMGSQQKTFVLQDLSCIISKPPYDRQQIIDTLRQVYNGFYSNEWGNGKKFTWKGKVGLLAGCTPEIEGHHIAMGELGERFLYYRMDADEQDTREKMMVKARAMEGHEKEARQQIAAAMHGVIAACKNRALHDVKVDGRYSEWLDALVDVTTSLRSTVKRNSYRREIIEYTPHKEGPGRMYKACQILLKSLATVRGKEAADEHDYEVVVKVCVDSIPSVRREVMKGLMKIARDGGGGVRAKDIARLTGYQSTESVGYHLADLAALGIADRWLQDSRSEASTNSPWLYEVNKEVYKRLETCGLADLF